MEPSVQLAVRSGAGRSRGTSARSMARATSATVIRYPIGIQRPRSPRGAVPKPASDEAAAVAPRARLEPDPALAAELADRVEQHTSLARDPPAEQVEHGAPRGGFARGVERQDDGLSRALGHSRASAERLDERDTSWPFRAGQ